MYGALFRRMPGNVILRTVQMIILFVAVTYALFNWGFPWLTTTFGSISDPQFITQ